MPSIPAASSAQPAGFRGLFLGLTCPECSHAFTVPAPTTSSRATCPACMAVVPVPTVDASTTGSNPMPKISEPTAWRCQCPNCDKYLRVPLQALSMDFRCPRCNARLAAAVVSRQTTDTEHDTVPAGKQPHQSQSSPATPPPPPPRPQEEPKDKGFVFVDRPESDANGEPEPPPPVPESPPVNVFCEESTFRGKALNPRWTRRLVFLAMLLGPPLVLFSATGATNNGMYGALGLVWLLLSFFRWMPFGLVSIGIPIDRLSRFITSLIINRLRCPLCGFEVPTVSIWSSGGYTDHRERHILRFRSPLTGEHIGWTDCPQCGATILL